MNLVELQDSELLSTPSFYIIVHKAMLRGRHHRPAALPQQPVFISNYKRKEIND